MHMAVGTSLSIITVTFISSLLAHLKLGSVRWDLVKKFLPGLIFGVILGAVIANYLPSKFLRIFFSVFLFYLAYRLFKKELAQGTGILPANWIVTLVMAVIGVLSSLLGAGGGTVLIPFMVRYQVDVRAATGTSVACGMGIGIVASICFMVLGHTAALSLPWSTGFIYWPAFLGVASASVLFAPLGTAVAYRISPAILKRILAIFLVLVGMDMLLLM